MSLCTEQYTILLSGKDKFDIIDKKTREVKATVGDPDDAIKIMLMFQHAYNEDLKNSCPAVFLE